MNERGQLILIALLIDLILLRGAYLCTISFIEWATK